MNARTKTAASRLVALLAAVGMLVLSSGIALIMTAPSASAAAGPKECTEGTGWIEVNVNALTYTYNAPADKVITDVCAKGPDAFPVYVAHLDPAQTSYTFKSVDFGWFNDNDQAQEISHIGVKLADEPEEQPLVTTASVSPVQPTCVNSNAASYTTSGEHVTFEQSAAPAPGASITVTAKTVAGWVFEGGATTKDFPLVFNAAETACDRIPPAVSPPAVNPPATKTPQTKSTTVVTPTVVHAGLGEAAADVRTQQGLALLVAGLAMLVAAGGLRTLQIGRRI